MVSILELFAARAFANDFMGPIAGGYLVKVGLVGVAALIVFGAVVSSLNRSGISWKLTVGIPLALLAAAFVASRIWGARAERRQLIERKAADAAMQQRWEAQEKARASRTQP